MITIRRLCDCTLQDVILAWNEGFEGYFVKMNFSLEQFLKRLVHEELSAKHSILLYDGDTPVGIVLNGMREIDGKKLAWNGGTGIAPAYRNKGLGRLAIAECIRIYEEEGVESATLEAIAENHPAIGLYEKMGYKTIGRLMNYSCSKSIGLPARSAAYRTEVRSPAELSRLPFFHENRPWQTQRRSIQNGEAIVLIDEVGKECAYAIYQKGWQENGDLQAIYLYQAELCSSPKPEMAEALLQAVFGASPVSSYVINLPLKEDGWDSTLKEMGFKETVGQVWMEYSLK